MGALSEKRRARLPSLPLSRSASRRPSEPGEVARAGPRRLDKQRVRGGEVKNSYEREAAAHAPRHQRWPHGTAARDPAPPGGRCPAGGACVAIDVGFPLLMLRRQDTGENVIVTLKISKEKVIYGVLDGVNNPTNSCGI